MDLTHLTPDEKINGIGSLKVPNYLRKKVHGQDVRETMAQLAEMIIQLGVNLSLDPDEALEWARKLQESVSQSEFDSWVATLLDGGPSIFMNTLNELQTTYPNGAPGVALVRETDPAKIYVWNGSVWEDFGDYQGIEIKDGSVTATKIADKAVTFGKIDNLIEDKSTNRFDINKLTYDKAYTSYGEYGDNPNYAITGFINLEPNDVLRTNLSVYAGIVIFDSTQNFLGVRQAGATPEPLTYTATTDVYVILQVRKEYINEFMYTINQPLPLQYESFKDLKYIEWLDVKPNSVGSSEIKQGAVTMGNLSDGLVSAINNISYLTGKKIEWFGDSIVAYNGTTNPSNSGVKRGYQTLVDEYLGTISSTFAVGGMSMADTTNGADDGLITQVNKYTANTDLVIISIGINDYRLNVPIGNLGDLKTNVYDTSTFLGAYRRALDSIFTKNKKQNVILMTPIQRYLTYEDNTSGFDVLDYVEAVKSVGKMYGIPVFDAYALGGINPINYGEMLVDEVHPTNEGYEAITKTLVPFIKNSFNWK